MKFTTFPRPLSNSATRSQAEKPAPRFRAALLGVLAFAGSAAPALAQDAPSVKAKQASPESLWLTIDNPTRQTLQMQVVRLDNNNILSNEVNRQASYGCQLNFHDFPAGQYAVLLRVGHERFRYNVQVQTRPRTSTISVQGLSKPTTNDAVVSVL